MSSAALKETPLAQVHVAAGARMVDFGGWSMPVNYGSQIEEHHAVRADAGLFDVSHMLNVDLTGADATAYLRLLLANDVARLSTPGKALYSAMLNPQGGVIDDLIVYFFTATDFRLVVNAGCADKDIAWMRRVAASRGLRVKYFRAAIWRWWLSRGQMPARRSGLPARHGVPPPSRSSRFARRVSMT